MALCETEALVLRTYNLAEADKIVVSLTYANGLVRAVAQGCRRLKNRFGAALEPFTLLQITYYQKENKDLASLRQVEIIKSHFYLSSDAETLTGLAYMADLVIEFSPPHQANERLFRMVKACLGAVAACPGDLLPVLRYFEIWLLKLEGFLPDIRRCAECHLSFDQDRIAFVGSDLVLRCRSCGRGTGTPLSHRLYRQLRATQKLPPCVFAEESRKVPTETLRELAELTHSFLGRVLERQPKVRSTFP
jgi:DNA repair protein RecO (recombination protein O)